METADIYRAVQASFLDDVYALKPGNVSVYADGHDMSSRDFIRSAEICTPILCERTTRFGRRILDAVHDTMTEVGYNTNLGMLLLFVPIIRAVEDIQPDGIYGLRQGLSKVLREIDRADTEDVFNAIRLANPGGLGHADRHDVGERPDCGLIEAMRAASERDYIAAQYVHGFEDVVSTGFNNIKYFVNCWNSVEWATVACYLVFMSSLQDSHIRRKFGVQTAEYVRTTATPIADRFTRIAEPDTMRDELMDYDRDLKKKNINPGTSADLTVASVLVYRLLFGG